MAAQHEAVSERCAGSDIGKRKLTNYVLAKRLKFIDGAGDGRTYMEASFRGCGDVLAHQCGGAPESADVALIRQP